MMQWWVFALVALLGGCNESRSTKIADPIPDMPGTQQRTVDRSEFGWRWPFSVGTGTLGCGSGAVVFRTGDRTYALNDAAMAKGFASVKPLQVVVEPPPRNPLARVKQETRMQIFARAAACGETGSERAVAAGACRQRLRDAHGLSDDELKQIEAEGTERRWRPLSPEYRSLAPLVEAGLKLCPAAQRRASLTYPQLLESQIHAGALTVDPALEMRNRSLNSTLPL